MKKFQSDPSRLYLALILVIVFLIILFLSISTFYINYWPTDSENPYLPTAAKLFTLPHLSSMHDLPQMPSLKLTMRCKETLILGIALMQKIFNDYESLYPNVFLLILATGISSVLIYLIIKRLFDSHI